MGKKGAKIQSFSANKEKKKKLKYEESCEALNCFMHSENEP